MVKDAELHKEEDAKRKSAIEARNQGDNLVYQVEKSLEENKDKIGEEAKNEITKAKDELKETLKNENATKEDIESKIKSLNDSFTKAMAAAAAANPNGAGASGAGGGTDSNKGKKKDDDVVDAEVL